MIDKRFVLLGDSDNVFVCCGRVSAGELVLLEGGFVTVQTDIDVGHKVARRDISKGTKVIKYNASIGSAIDDIAFGQHIHLHNMKSDYIPSHTRESKVEVEV